MQSSSKLLYSRPKMASHTHVCSVSFGACAQSVRFPWHNDLWWHWFCHLHVCVSKSIAYGEEHFGKQISTFCETPPPSAGLLVFSVAVSCAAYPQAFVCAFFVQT